MDHVKVCFGARIRGRFSAQDLATRLGHALHCTFVLSEDPRDPGNTMVAEVLFLHLTILYSPCDEPCVEGKDYLYVLHGRSIDANPWESTAQINLSEWLLAKLRLLDSPDWYIPTLEELHAEIDAPAPSSAP